MTVQAWYRSNKNMSFEENIIGTKPPVGFQRSKKSWKSVTKAIGYYEEGKYGRALPRLFKYEDVEPTAMFCLACMYMHGQGVIQNKKTAASYLLKLVDYGDIRPEEENLLSLAHYYLGDLYYRGVVFYKDASKAVKHWRKGAALRKNECTDRYHVGTIKCQTALGMFYSDPKLKKTKKALYWHKRAADAGSILSEGALGVIYMYGIGTEEDVQLAYNHLTNAAVTGNIYAKGYLVAYYYKRQMYHRAVSYGKELSELEDYELLAKQNECDVKLVKQGVAVGCFYLAMCLQYGYAAEKNIRLAKALIKRALEMSTDIIYDLHVQAILGTV